MKKRLLLVVGILGLVAAIWFVLSRDPAEAELAFDAEPGSPPAAADPAAIAPPASSLLTAELPAATGELSISGRVLGPEGPVAGAVVVATAGAGEELLSELACHCTPSCTRRLVECGCSHASLRVAELAVARRGEAPPVARATSAEDGTFVVTGLEPGAYALWAERPGSLIGLRRGVSAGDQDADVEISEGMTLRGKVVGDEEKPLAGAVVTAIYEAHARFFDAVSGADGTFAIGPVPRGDFAVVASARELLPAHVGAEPDTTRLPDLQLFSPRVVSGRAVRDGEPVAGASVTLEEGHNTLSATTDAQGGFRFEQLRPESYELVARQGLSFAARELSLKPGKDIRDLVLDLAPGGEIVGTVRSESGAPLADVEVTSHPDGRESSTDAGGRFRIGPLGAGSYSVSTEARGFLGEHREGLDVRVGLATSVDFVLRPAALLRGVVVDAEGQPVYGAMVGAWWRTSGSGGDSDPGLEEEDDLPGRSGSAESKRDGSFEIDGLAAGSFDLQVTHEEFSDHEEVVEAPRSDLRVVLQPGLEVVGTVEDEKGEPVSGVMVSLRPDNEEEQQVRASARGAQATDARGKFRIRGVEKGRYLVSAMERPAREHETLRMVSARVAVHGERTPPVKLRFKAGESISGRVQTSAGEPVDGASVSAAPDDPGARRRRVAALDGLTFGHALSGADGSFELRNLKPGKYLLTAEKEGFTPSSAAEGPMAASTGDGAVSLVLKSESKVHGRVVDPEGKPIKHFTIDRQDHHDDGGHFEQPIYREGETVLNLAAEGFASTARRFPARFGETIDLGDVVLTRGRTLSGTVLDSVTNEPVPGALVDTGDPVDLGRLDSIRLAVEAGAVETGADGSFTLPRVDSSRPLALFAFHPSYRWWAQPLDPAAPRVVIKLDRGGTLVGRVLDLQGQPIAGTGVAVGLGTAFKRGTTGEDGSFEIKGLAFGPATVVAQPEGELPIPPQKTVIPAEGVARVELREEAGGAKLVVQLVGSVGARRSPFLIPGNVPMPASANELIASIVTGIRGAIADGQEAAWEFEHVPPGPTTVFVGEPAAKMRLSRHLIQVTEEPLQRVEIEVPEKLTEIPNEP